MNKEQNTTIKKGEKKMENMKTYTIYNEVSGLELGKYHGETAEDAHRAMIRDAGYTHEDTVKTLLEDTNVVVEEVDGCKPTWRGSWGHSGETVEYADEQAFLDAVESGLREMGEWDDALDETQTDGWITLSEPID